MGITTVYGSLMGVGVDLVLLVAQTTMPIPLELTVVWSEPVCSSLTNPKSIPNLTIRESLIPEIHNLLSQ
jgi:hypothetical protein